MIKNSKCQSIVGLHLCERILKITDNLSKTLQTQSMCASEAQVIAKMTVQTLEGMRNGEIFKLFFKHVENLCQRPGERSFSVMRQVKTYLRSTM